MPWARGTLPPPPILWGTSLCFKQGRAAKTFRLPLKVLKCSEGPSAMPHLFGPSASRRWLKRHLRGGHEGQPAEPVCISALGLVLLQGRNRDPISRGRKQG